jgi:hypothetical protein
MLNEARKKKREEGEGERGRIEGASRLGVI